MNINNVGVVGAGTMGNGIAHVFSLFNFNVTLVDIRQDILDRALKNIKSNMTRQLNKGHIDNDKLVESFNRINSSINIRDLSHCDLIIEAIKEDLNLKSNLFRDLNSICSKNTILASNTSSISINELSKSTKTPENVIGMHFMNPAPVMKLVEVINGTNTGKGTTRCVMEIAKTIDKIPIECNDSPGFVSNRILMPMINEAAYCYQEKIATVESIDSIMKLGMGHPMGPLTLADLIGIDVCVHILNVLYKDFKNDKYKPCKLLADMVNQEKLGKKTGEGFYKYEL